ncbi:MAG: sensor histidine kinase [Rhizomicrobium sp.]
MAGLPGGTGERGGAYGAPALVHFLVGPRSQAMRFLWFAGGLAAASLATALRLQLGLGAGSGIPLMFYFPAVMAITLLAGWEYGTAALAVSIGIAWFAFAPPYFSFQFLSQSQATSLALWTLSSVPVVVLAHYLRVTLAASLRNEERYRQLMSVISDVVWLTDSEGNVREPNPAWARVTGMEWPFYRGRAWIEAVFEDDREALRPDEAAGTHLADFRLRDAATGNWRWYRSRAVALRNTRGEIEEWMTAIRDVHESRLDRERDALVIGEARHRLKNLVAIIEGLAKFSRRRGGEPSPELEDYLRRFLGRLHALGAAGDLVIAGGHKELEAGSLIRATLAPFLEEKTGRFTIDGPELLLSEATGGSLALAMHELATNALKYGALSEPGGRVTIVWTATPGEDGERVNLEWRETGGPSPGEPDRKGFGSRVIESVPARERNGEVVMDYRPEGLFCRIAFTRAPQPAAT